MNKKPNISKKLLDKINSVHAMATPIFNSISPEVFQDLRIAVSQVAPSPRKLKR